MSKVSQVEAAKRLLTLKKASQTFKGFVRAMTPQFELADFQLELIQALEDLEQGIGPRKLLITMPPRHGKSWLASTLFPIYYLAKKPNRNILATSYNQDLAKTFGRQTRDNAREPLVAQAFPDFVLSEESRAVDDWRTTYGGTYYATGMGGSTTGRAATLLLIDDPIKAREEADSPTQRNKTWSYYVSALTTRKQPEPDGTKPIEIVILTRWHPDDLAGRIMETEDWKNGEWKHINFPAIREVNANIKKSVAGLPESDPRYIPQGELSSVAPSKRYYYEKEMRALWEVRFPIEELEKRRKLDPREFESLYQQNPYIQGGNLIKSSWWQTYDPEDVEPPQMLLVAADTAFKKTETADYSVLMTLGMTRSGDIYIMDVVRDRYDFPELKRACIMINNVNRGRGLRGFYIEDKASGQSLIQELKSQSGMSVIPYKVNTDKVARLNSVTPLIEGGRVFLPKSAPWLDIFMAEAETFPNGKHDDQMDALSIGLDAMSRMSVSTGDVFTAPIDPRTSLNNSLNGQVQKNQGWTRDHNGNWVDDIGKEKTYTVWGEL
jgi:predicted phage terminase large subunit-like protein